MECQEYFAHIRVDENGKRHYQTVAQHCINAAVYAADDLEQVGLNKCGYVTGLLHDQGKFSENYQQYLDDAVSGKPVRRGSVNHTFAGVKYILEELEANDPECSEFVPLVRDTLAYAAGAHHGQFDCRDENGKDGFEHRREVNEKEYFDVINNYINSCCNRTDLNDYFRDACREFKAVYMKAYECVLTIKDQRSKMDTLCFFSGLIARLVQSAVIDGDRKDTAEFMKEIKYPTIDTDINKCWHTELDYVESKILKFEQTSKINKSRRVISDLCRKMAESAPGLYRLNVPTGAGKTLSSLRFALAHAERWGKKRIIFTSPLLSILEQNAQVIHDFISDQSLILEHHSNVIQPIVKNDELNFNELLTETWNSPIIITTLVQLLNTMCSGETSSSRRFHALCNSIIVIDEVQSVPNHLLTLFNQTISFLCHVCGTTIVLCSATQPYLEGAQHPILVESHDIVPFNQEIWEPFHRTEIIDAGNCRFDELGEKIETLAAGAKSVLVVCNKKSESEKLFEELSAKFDCYHLSASMCMEHRRKVLAQMKARLNGRIDRTMVCVSTQVIEAGVDISFERVIRLLAGMDNVVQAAGRCNRNGESKVPSPVYVINCTDESLKRLTEISRAKDASVELLYEFKKNPDKFDRRLTSDFAIRDYYRKLYGDMPEKYQDAMIKGKSYSVYSLLGMNAEFISAGAADSPMHILNQAFKLAGNCFEIFEGDTLDVITPYGKGKDIIAELCSSTGYFRADDVLKQAKGYTVSLYPYQKTALEEIGAIEYLADRAISAGDKIDAWVLRPEFYSEQTGVTVNKQASEYLEV